MKLHKIEKVNITFKECWDNGTEENEKLWYKKNIMRVLKRENAFIISSFNLKFFAGLSLISLISLSMITVVVFGVFAISILAHYIIRKRFIASLRDMYFLAQLDTILNESKFNDTFKIYDTFKCFKNGTIGK